MHLTRTRVLGGLYKGLMSAQKEAHGKGRARTQVAGTR